MLISTLGLGLVEQNRMVSGWQEISECVHTHVGGCLSRALHTPSLKFYTLTCCAVGRRDSSVRSGDRSLVPCWASCMDGFSGA